ncbi:hypothetical protein Tco_1367319 [Tanacetum coccineum]
MSDSEHSTVTYTSVSKDDSEIGSPGVDGPPIMPEDPYAYIMAAYGVPPSPDYIPSPEGPPSPDDVPGPEEPEQAPPSPVYLPYVPEPVYPEYIPPEDDCDPEEDPADYPTDKDDDDDEEEEEEEEHPAPADSVPPVERLLALTTPPPSPLTPLSSPLPQIPSPPPNSPTHIEIPKSCLPLRKRVRFVSPTPSREVGESSVASAARQDRPTIAMEDLYGFVDMVDVPPRCSTSRELDYGIIDTWDDLVGATDEIAPTTVEGVNQRVTDLATIVEEETTSMYGIMEDAQDDRSLLRARVNMLYKDRPFHRRTALLMKEEARQSEIAELQATDRMRQTVISDLLKADYRRQRQLVEALKIVKSLKTQMIELQRPQGPAKDPAEPELPEEASSSS